MEHPVCTCIVIRTHLSSIIGVRRYRECSIILCAVFNYLCLSPGQIFMRRFRSENFFSKERTMYRQKFQSSSDKNISYEMEQSIVGPSFVVDPSFNFVSILSTHGLHEFFYDLMYKGGVLTFVRKKKKKKEIWNSETSMLCFQCLWRRVLSFWKFFFTKFYNLSSLWNWVHSVYIYTLRISKFHLF